MILNERLFALPTGIKPNSKHGEDTLTTGPYETQSVISCWKSKYKLTSTFPEIGRAAAVVSELPNSHNRVHENDPFSIE